MKNEDLDLAVAEVMASLVRDPGGNYTGNYLGYMFRLYVYGPETHRTYEAHIVYWVWITEEYGRKIRSFKSVASAVEACVMYINDNRPRAT